MIASAQGGQFVANSCTVVALLRKLIARRRRCDTHSQAKHGNEKQAHRVEKGAHFSLAVWILRVCVLFDQKYAAPLWSWKQTINRTFRGSRQGCKEQKTDGEKSRRGVNFALFWPQLFDTTTTFFVQKTMLRAHTSWHLTFPGLCAAQSTCYQRYSCFSRLLVRRRLGGAYVILRSKSIDPRIFLPSIKRRHQAFLQAPRRPLRTPSHMCLVFPYPL